MLIVEVWLHGERREDGYDQRNPDAELTGLEAASFARELFERAWPNAGGFDPQADLWRVQDVTGAVHFGTVGVAER